MKKARFTQDQIIGILKEHRAADLCRRHGISDATFYTWRSKYGGTEVSEARRLLAESVMDVSTLKDLDAEAHSRLHDLAGDERRRFGYRRLHILVEREGVTMNHKKLFRLYREEGLSVRKRGSRKRAMGTGSPMMLPDGPNQCWSLDFVSDALNNGRRFRMLTVVDDYTRECLALSGERLGRELDRIGEHRGFPMMIVSDNSTEMTSNAILAWQKDGRCCGTTSHQASCSRTGSSRASTAGSGTNASTRTCSETSPTLGRSSTPGEPTTTPSRPTPASTV